MNVLEFATDCKVALWPVQQVVLKMVYNLPLEKEEADYITRLHEEGRCNHPDLPPTGVRKIHLSAGRRAGKSHIMALLTAYETYQQTFHPASEFPVHIMLSGPTQDYTTHTVKVSQDILDSSGNLQERAANRGSAYSFFQTEGDIEATGPWVGSRRTARASVRFQVAAAQAKALRGRFSIFIGVEEADFLARASGDDVVGASLLSTQRSGGKVVLFSTPNPYQTESVFRNKRDEWWGDPDALCLEIPTWEMNPTFPKGELEKLPSDIPEESEFGGSFVKEITAMLPERVLATITKKAEEKGMSLDAVVKNALEAWLKDG